MTKHKSLGSAILRRGPYNFSSITFALLALAVAERGAAATEYVLPVTPPGATDIDQAVLPPLPGFYGGIGVLPMNQNSHIYDQAGHQLPASETAKLSVPAAIAALLYVYPIKPWGWTIASSFIQPVTYLSYSIGASPNTTQFALSDAYSDIFVATKNLGLFGAIPGNLRIAYGLNVGVGLAMIVPDGGYIASRPISLSANAWAPDPNFAVTWNSGPRFSLFDNIQLGTKLYYAFPQINPTMNYQSGQILDLDMAATAQIGEWHFGVAGSYQKQTTADRPPAGVTLIDGNRYTEATAGPVIEYTFPTGAFIKAKYQYTFEHRNTLDEQFLALELGFKL